MVGICLARLMVRCCAGVNLKKQKENKCKILEKINTLRIVSQYSEIMTTVIIISKIFWSLPILRKIVSLARKDIA